MKKHSKIICAALVLLCACLLLVGCSSRNDSSTATDLPQDINELYLENVCVDIASNDNGFYSLFANVNLYGDENGIYSLYITNPIVLSFNVSDSYIGGVCLINGVDIETLLDRLNTMSEDIESGDKNSALEKLKEVVDFLSEQAVYDYCPT